jgi:hypothetical protein
MALPLFVVSTVGRALWNEISMELVTHNGAPQSVGLLWTSVQLVAETSTWQHPTDKNPCPQWDFLFIYCLRLFRVMYFVMALFWYSTKDCVPWIFPLWKIRRLRSGAKFRSPDRPACSQSLYRLSYPGLLIHISAIICSTRSCGHPPSSPIYLKNNKCDTFTVAISNMSVIPVPTFIRYKIH